jgi:hypothetical protein
MIHARDPEILQAIERSDAFYPDLMANGARAIKLED